MIVAGLGQCTVDYIAVVDELPQEDVKFEVPSWHIEGGGPVATALVVLSRFGINTRFMGIISDDPAGMMIRQGLLQEGVDISFMVERQGGISQTAFILANKRRQTRTIIWCRPTVGPVYPDEVTETFLEGVSLLHVDGLMTESAIRAASLARGLGVPVMYDAGSVRPGSEKLIRLCDYVVCSEAFSRTYCSHCHESTLKDLLSAGVKTATVTYGQAGSITATRDKLFHQPAYDVEAVDTTGAGDVFHGAYIYGILHNWPIEKTVRLATAAAGLKCTRPGGRSGIPSVQEALDFMEKAGIRND